MYCRGCGIVSCCRITRDDATNECVGYEIASTIETAQMDEVPTDTCHEIVGRNVFIIWDDGGKNVLQRIGIDIILGC